MKVAHYTWCSASSPFSSISFPVMSSITCPFHFSSYHQFLMAEVQQQSSDRMPLVLLRLPGREVPKGFNFRHVSPYFPVGPCCPPLLYGLLSGLMSLGPTAGARRAPLPSEPSLAARFLNCVPHAPRLIRKPGRSMSNSSKVRFPFSSPLFSFSSYLFPSHFTSQVPFSDITFPWG